MRRVLLTWLADQTGIELIEAMALRPIYVMSIAAGVAVLMGARAIRREGLSVRDGALCVAAALVGGGLLGHWVSLAFNPHIVLEDPIAIIIVFNGGFSSMGVYAGAVGGMAIYARLKRLPFWRYADAMAPGMLIAAALARLNCLLAGCDFGKVAVGFPLAIRYPRGTAAFRYLDELGMAGDYQQVGLPMHPFPLYESVPVAAVGIALVMFPKLFGEGVGQRAAGAAVAYCTIRFAAEFFRADTVEVGGVITVLQILSMVGVLIFGFFWFRSRPSQATVTHGALVPEPRSI